MSSVHNLERGAEEKLATGASILTSWEFTREFKAPNYLLDGVLQRGFSYSLTGKTGAGKTAIALLLMSKVARGHDFAGRETEPGRVLMLVGENPDDVRMRWIALAECEAFDQGEIDVHFMPGIFSLHENFERIKAYAAQVGGFALIYVDTSAAYFEGDDENSNTQLGDHARRVRALSQIAGNPCVVTNCHPVKGARDDNLVPRGGGAFLNEMDGNLTCKKDDNGMVELHWQGKFRGPEFSPIMFELRQYESPNLLNSKGQKMPTVVANALSASEARAKDDEAGKEHRALLHVMLSNPAASVATLAEQAGWRTPKGDPLKSKVSRLMSTLKGDGLVAKELGQWRLTPKGEKAAKRDAP